MERSWHALSSFKHSSSVEWSSVDSSRTPQRMSTTWLQNTNAQQPITDDAVNHLDKMEVTGRATEDA